MRYAIVLAAGKSTRMQSNQNKVMLPLLDKPIIGHVVDNLEDVKVDQVVVVTGFGKEDIKEYLKDKVDYAIQDEPKGTADAVSKASQLKDKKGATLIMYGDCALIQPETIEQIFKAHEGNNDLTIVSAKPDDLSGLSRIYRNDQGEIYKIVDSRNLKVSDLLNNEVSLGMYCVDNELLFKYLEAIESTHEFDEINIEELVSIMHENNHKIGTLKVDEYEELLGVNDRYQLNKANDYLKHMINEKHLMNGVTILDPNATYIGTHVTIGKDSIIYPNVHIYGDTVIGEQVEIKPNSWINNSTIGSGSKIDSSHIEDSIIGDNNKIGPYARIRAHSEIGDNVRIGNFVEFKKTKFGNNSACAHLSYLGNSIVGKYVNIGCGVVTVNYDGLNKHQTVIGDYAFVGSNSNLIAPITLGEKSVVAAGSTVSDDVEKGAMVIERGTRIDKPESGAKYLNKRKEHNEG